MSTLPIVTLRLEGMRAAISQAFASEMLNNQGQVDAAVARAVAEFNFERAVSEAVCEAVRDLLEQTVKSCAWDRDLREAVKAAVLRALQPEQPEPTP